MVLGLNGNIQESLSNNNMHGTITFTNPMTKKVVDKLMIPFVQRKWEELNHNYLLWNSRFEKSFDPESEYAYFLKMVELFLNEKAKGQATPKISEASEVSELSYILPPIRLKPEYEIHKLLYGTKFDKEKIARISALMKRDGMTIDKIRSLIGS